MQGFSSRCARVAALLAISASATAALAQTGNEPLAVPVPDSALGGRPTGPAPAAPSGAAPSSSVPISTAVPIPVIMVVDDQGIVEQSKAFKSIKSQMEGLGQAAEKEIAQKKNDLETAFQEFQRNARGGTIPADKIEEQRHDLALRQDALQKESDSRGQSLRQSYATALAKVKQSLFEIVRGLATERHSNLILLQSAAIPLDPAFDVSKEALVRLDKALPAVTVTVSTAPAAGTPAPAATAQTQPPKKK